MSSAGNGHEHLDSTDRDMDGLAEHWLAAMATLAMGRNNLNGTPDYTAPVLKPIVSNIYPLFVVQYGLLMLFGVAANVLIGGHVLRKRLYRDVTHALVLNLVLSHLVQCCVVMPMTLTVLLIQNWIFGQFFCYFLPMLQDIPLHVCMISHLLIAWDRLRWLSDPLKFRVPAFVCSCASWLAGIVITLPYPIYIIYMDLGNYLKEFQGVGFCTVNLVDDMHEYMRGLFITMFAVPAIVLSYLYIRTTGELRPPDGPLSMIMFEARAEARNRQSQSKDRAATVQQPTRSYDLYDAELDVVREKRTQNYLCSMAVVQVICITPLMVLRLARLVLEETYENTDNFDLTYLMFVWVAFLPTAINPCIYATWMLSRPTKERLRGYFQLSSKRRTSSTTSNPEEDQSRGVGSNGKGKAVQHKYRKSLKRTSDSSALTTLSSIRSTIAGGSHIVTVENAKENEPVRLPAAMGVTKNSQAPNSAFETRAVELLDPVFVSPYDIASSIKSSVSNLADSSSNLEQDLEIIDLLERERSMDIQEGLSREIQAAEYVNGGRRQLPSVQCHQSSRGHLASDQQNRRAQKVSDEFDELLKFSRTRPEYSMIMAQEVVFERNDRRRSLRVALHS